MFYVHDYERIARLGFRKSACLSAGVTIDSDRCAKDECTDNSDKQQEASHLSPIYVERGWLVWGTGVRRCPWLFCTHIVHIQQQKTEYNSSGMILKLSIVLHNPLDDIGQSTGGHHFVF